MIHELKTWPEYYIAVWEGAKPFEVRKDDRNYQIGDALHLREYDPIREEYTGSSHYQKVTYILRDENFVKDGFVIIGIEYGGTEK